MLTIRSAGCSTDSWTGLFTTERCATGRQKNQRTEDKR
jgi:hypothetical protein